MKTMNEPGRDEACCELQASELRAVQGGLAGWDAASLTALYLNGWQPWLQPQGYLPTVKG
jgi:hypothetical protein